MEIRFHKLVSGGLLSGIVKLALILFLCRTACIISLEKQFNNSVWNSLAASLYFSSTNNETAQKSGTHVCLSWCNIILGANVGRADTVKPGRSLLPDFCNLLFFLALTGVYTVIPVLMMTVNAVGFSSSRLHLELLMVIHTHTFAHACSESYSRSYIHTHLLTPAVRVTHGHTYTHICSRLQWELLTVIHTHTFAQLRLLVYKAHVSKVLRWWCGT